MTVAGESLLSLYKNSYTVQLLSCFYNLAWETAGADPGIKEGGFF